MKTLGYSNIALTFVALLTHVHIDTSEEPEISFIRDFSNHKSIIFINVKQNPMLAMLLLSAQP